MYPSSPHYRRLADWTTVLEVDKPFTVDTIGIRLALATSYKKTSVDICKAIIKQAPRVAPTARDMESDGDDYMAEKCSELIYTAYQSIGEGRLAPLALRLLMPFFRDPAFRTALDGAFNREVKGRADEQIVAMDLFGEAQDLKYPDWAPLNVTFTERSTLFDFIARREVYLPMANGGGARFFGARIDHGLDLRSYREMTEQFIPDKEWRDDLEVGRVLLELVDCAIEHFADVL